MHDNGKQFTSRIFRHFLVHHQIKDKQIPNSYPQLQGKVEAYNKIVKNEFVAIEDIPNIVDGKQRRHIWSHSIRGVPTKINYIHHTYKN